MTFSLSQIAQRPLKRLRLAVKRPSYAGPTIQTLTTLLDNAANSNAALQILIKVSDHLTNNFCEDLTEPIKKLSDHFKKEQESAVRVKVLSLFADFAVDSLADGTILVDVVVLLLKNEKSPRVTME